jgi:predicted transcriptional regulator
MRKAFSTFRFGSAPLLGPLERRLLHQIWSCGTATVRELIESGNVRQAYTTVMTTMDRLYKKGLLNREIEGRAFRYSARLTQEELQRGAALEGLRQLLRPGEAASLPLSYLVEALSEHDAQLLDELQVLIEKKRHQLKNTECAPAAARPKEPR